MRERLNRVSRTFHYFFLNIERFSKIYFLFKIFFGNLLIFVNCNQEDSVSSFCKWQFQYVYFLYVYLWKKDISIFQNKKFTILEKVLRFKNQTISYFLFTGKSTFSCNGNLFHSKLL